MTLIWMKHVLLLGNIEAQNWTCGIFDLLRDGLSVYSHCSKFTWSHPHARIHFAGGRMTITEWKHNSYEVLANLCENQVQALGGQGSDSNPTTCERSWTSLNQLSDLSSSLGRDRSFTIFFVKKSLYVADGVIVFSRRCSARPQSSWMSWCATVAWKPSLRNWPLWCDVLSHCLGIIQARTGAFVKLEDLRCGNVSKGKKLYLTTCGIVRSWDFGNENRKKVLGLQFLEALRVASELPGVKCWCLSSHPAILWRLFLISLDAGPIQTNECLVQTCTGISI